MGWSGGELRLATGSSDSDVMAERIAPTLRVGGGGVSSRRITQRLVSVKGEGGRSREVAAAWAISPCLIRQFRRLVWEVLFHVVQWTALRAPSLSCCEKSSSKDTESQTRRGQVVELKGGGRKEL